MSLIDKALYASIIGVIKVTNLCYVLAIKVTSLFVMIQT